MALRDLTSAQLERLIKLVREKQSLETRLERINGALAALDGGQPASARTASARPKTIRRQRRGKLKEGILKALTEAGKKGMSVKELAEQLRAKPSSVSIWFYTTGKKVKGIAKIGPARYSYSAA